MFAKAPPPRKKDPGPKKVEKPAVEDETSPGKENRMNEAAEEREEAEVKGKKKRGAAARAESKPKRKRIQVGPRGEMICKIVHNKPAVLIFFPSQYSRNRS